MTIHSITYWYDQDKNAYAISRGGESEAWYFRVPDAFFEAVRAVMVDDVWPDIEHKAKR